MHSSAVACAGCLAEVAGGLLPGCWLAAMLCDCNLPGCCCAAALQPAWWASKSSCTHWSAQCTAAAKAGCRRGLLAKGVASYTRSTQTLQAAARERARPRHNSGCHTQARTHSLQMHHSDMTVPGSSTDQGPETLRLPCAPAAAAAAAGELGGQSAVPGRNKNSRATPGCSGLARVHTAAAARRQPASCCCCCCC